MKQPRLAYQFICITFLILLSLNCPAHGTNQPQKSGLLRAEWIGQDGSDKVGPSPKLGPSDVQDIHVVLDGLPVGSAITQLEIGGQGGDLWRFGEPVGPFLCGIERTDLGSRADLYLEPSRIEQGRPFEIKITYNNNRKASLIMRGGKANPLRRVPEATLHAVWIGINGTDLVGPARAPGPDGRADAVIELSGLSQRTPVRTLLISEPSGAAWSMGPTPRKTRRAELITAPEPGKARIHFQPEGRANLSAFTVNLTYDNMSEDSVLVQGTTRDPGVAQVNRLANPPLADPTTRRAAFRNEDHTITQAYTIGPGENLAKSIEQHDHIRLTSGTYDLDEPLILQKPIVIEAEPGTSLMFRQRPDSEPWTSAIAIRSSRIRLQGFAVRCQGPIRWNEAVSYGPALIGGPLDGDDRPGQLDLEGLDLRSPPPSSKAWPEALRLARLVKVVGGSIRECVLQGGMVEFAEGPWVIANNRHRGSIDGAQTAAAFSGHSSDRLILKGNQVEPVGTGKLWRFLVLSGRGDDIQISENRIKGVGPGRTDPLPHPNAPEVILTESYRIHYEGKIAGLSPDGRALAIHQPQGPPIYAGAVVAILDGPDAGRWRRVVIVNGPTNFVIDQAIPEGTESVSITTGFVGMRITGNTIDCRGRDLACPLVLVGNHFGTEIEANILAGGAEAFRLAAAPTEEPVRWGWTHAPFIGVRMINNRFEDCGRAGSIMVDHSNAVEPGAGRVYLSVEARGNRCTWLKPGGKAREALKVGADGGIDPGELLYFDRDNTSQFPNRVDVHSATVNQVAIPSGTFSWPLANKTGGL